MQRLCLLLLFVSTHISGKRFDEVGFEKGITRNRDTFFNYQMILKRNDYFCENYYSLKQILPFRDGATFRLGVYFMKIAAIDIGSNAARMQISSVLTNKKTISFKKVEYVRFALRSIQAKFLQEVKPESRNYCKLINF